MRAWTKAFLLALVSMTVLATQAPANAEQSAHHYPKTVLGSAKFAGPYSEGWGHAHPKEIFNGGDPSGLVSKITWKHWGARSSYGWGKTAIFRPQGGYYPGLVRAELRAQNVGHCGSHRAYTHLYVREPSKPGGKLGKWFSWSYNNHTLCTNGFG